MSESHPVWDVYDQLRTARLNEKYYGIRLQHYERINRYLEIIVAATTTSSAIAGVKFWASPAGAEIWQILLILSAVIATLKPIINMTRTIKLYEELLTGYRLMYHDLKDLKIDINQTKSYTDNHLARLKEIIKKEKLLQSKSPERSEKEKLKEVCQQEVLEEFPADSFYIPE